MRQTKAPTEDELKRERHELVEWAVDNLKTFAKRWGPILGAATAVVTILGVMAGATMAWSGKAEKVDTVQTRDFLQFKGDVNHRFDGVEVQIQGIAEKQDRNAQTMAHMSGQIDTLVANQK